MIKKYLSDLAQLVGNNLIQYADKNVDSSCSCLVFHEIEPPECLRHTKK